MTRVPSQAFETKLTLKNNSTSENLNSISNKRERDESKETCSFELAYAQVVYV